MEKTTRGTQVTVLCVNVILNYPETRGRGDKGTVLSSPLVLIFFD